MRKAAPLLNPESSTHPEEQPVCVVISGGGTGGHISPALAVAAELRNRGPVDLHWIGSHSGFESDAARENDIPFHAVRTGKLRRYFSRETAVDLFRVPAGIVEARRLLKRIRPDVIFSTGGFVSTPAVVAGRTLGIPSLTHEQTASLGLATRINARFCDVVALSFPGSNDAIKIRPNARVEVTGNPVRPTVVNGSKEMLRTLYDMPAGLPVIYVTGGAQGAHAINSAIEAALPRLVQDTVVIHQCGPQAGNGDFQRLVELREDLDDPIRNRYFPVERVGDELAHIYAGASLVIGRSGAGTVAELAALGLPSILVPLPGAEEQLRNAHILADAGAAIILKQPELTPDRLLDSVRSILNDNGKIKEMRLSARSVSATDAASRLADELLRLISREQT